MPTTLATRQPAAENASARSHFSASGLASLAALLCAAALLAVIAIASHGHDGTVQSNGDFMVMFGP